MTDEASDLKLRAAIDARKPLIRGVIEFIHGHPELAHEERASAAYLARTLAELGLTVETEIAGMSTAFRATLRGGRPGRTIGLVANYDAVPSVTGPGNQEAIHACGHGPISAGVVAAVAALATDREALAGSVVVMGCPADEVHSPGTSARGGGKAISADARAWDGIDVALYAHPEFIDTVWEASAWMRRDTLRLRGSRTLIDGARQVVLGDVAALIAALGAAPAAQAMLETLQLDGDVEEGAGLAALARVLIWASDEADLDQLAARIRAAVGGDWESGRPVPGIVPNAAVRDAVVSAHRAAGRLYVYPPMPLPFATDFGAISRRLPSALIGVGRPGGWSFHTPAGADEFASEHGVQAGFDVATVLALAVTRLTAPG